MKKLITLTLALFSSASFADSIRTSDGISCSFDADESPFEVSVYAENGTFDEDQESGYGDYYSDSNQNSVGIQFTYKIGTPARLDCGKLYALELRTKEARVKELEAKIAAFESASTVSWN